jgi:hypothetical protein
MQTVCFFLFNAYISSSPKIITDFADLQYYSVQLYFNFNVETKIKIVFSHKLALFLTCRILWAHIPGVK